MTERKQPKIKFVGLHAHSTFSVFDGFGFPGEHIDFAWENGMDALALTDHGHMNGLAHQVSHAKKMNKAGKKFKPIFGVEAYFIPSISEWKTAKEEYDADKETMDDDSLDGYKNAIKHYRHMVLLAQNQTGLKNIFKLVSMSHKGDNFYRRPRIDYDMLRQYSEGVVATSACMGGIYGGDYWQNRHDGDDAVYQAMRETTEQMLAIFGDRWYGELQWNNLPDQHKINQFIIRLHHEYGIPLTSAADSHYPRPEMWKDRELYKRLGWLNKSKPDYMKASLPDSLEDIGYELYPKNGDEMWESYKKYSKACGEEYDDDLVLNAIEESYRIAHEVIEDFYPDTAVKLPSFVVPEGKTSEEEFIEQCEKAFAVMEFESEEQKQVYRERMDEEIHVITKRGFSQYFLTSRAVCDLARKRMLIGPARGSAAGSLVAFLLEITDVDPVKYGLLFSRFLRADATDYPDIDIDFESRDELMHLLIELWGEEHVVPITNFSTMQLKSLLKDISKYYGIDYQEVNAVTDVMEAEAIGPAKEDHGIKAGVYVPTFEEVKKYSPTLKAFLAKYPEVETHVNAIYGSVRSLGRHAGGIVISENLSENMPLIKSGDIIQTPWSEGQAVRNLEPMGFIKFDFLGLKTLAMIRKAIQNILGESASFEDVRAYYDKHLNPRYVDFKDLKVYREVFQKGSWAGIFQFDSGGMQRLSVESRPENLIDITSLSSIYRPGPLSAGVGVDYVNAKRNPEGIEYAHKIVEEVTAETYGFLIFQEQIAILAHRLGKGITLDEGNKLRKMLTKKGSKSADLNSIFERFIEGCVEKGMLRSDAVTLWQNFIYFSGYGFNKSHALSYSIISYQCAWLMTYHRDAWLAAFLDIESGDSDRKEAAVQTVKSFGYTIGKPDVNESGLDWKIGKNGKLIPSLTSIRGIGEKAIDEILTHRPFISIEDYYFHDEMTGRGGKNKKTVDALCRSGAFECLMDDRFGGNKMLWDILVNHRPKSKKKFYEVLESWEGDVDFTDEEEVQNILELTGAYPLSLVVGEEDLKRVRELCIPGISETGANSQIFWGVVHKTESRVSKKGKPYLIIHAMDDTFDSKIVRCWAYNPAKDNVQTNKLYLMKLSYSSKWGYSVRSISRNFISI